MITEGSLSENYSEKGLGFLFSNGHQRQSKRIPKGYIEIISKVLLSTAAAIVTVCLYFNWVIVYADTVQFGSFTLFQLSNGADAGLILGGGEAISVILRVAIILTTVFWAVFIWRVVVYSVKYMRLFAYIAGMLTVSLVIGISMSVTAVNSLNAGVGNLPPGFSGVHLYLAPFITAVFSITIMLAVSLMYQRQKRKRRAGVSVRNALPEDMGVRIKADADYRLMYHGGHNSVGFVADMGEFWGSDISAEITESMIKNISEELRVCMNCGEFVRHKVSVCTNCGSIIPGKQK